MPIVNAFSKAMVREFSLDELQQAARLIRGYSLVALCAAGAADPAATLSIAEIVATLYLKVAVHDPNNPDWNGRDRIVWPVSGPAAALYLGLGLAGYFPLEDVVTMGRLGSRLSLPPRHLQTPGVEATVTAPAAGVGLAAGMALAASRQARDYSTFCLLNQDDLQGSVVWEALAAAARMRLPRLIAVVQYHAVDELAAVALERLSRRFQAIGWRALDVDGHDTAALADVLQQAKSDSAQDWPTAVLAKTIRGNGVGFLECRARHDVRPLSTAEMLRGLKELDLDSTIAYEALLARAASCEQEAQEKLTTKTPQFGQAYAWNAQERMRVELEPAAAGLEIALRRRASDLRLACLDETSEQPLPVATGLAQTGLTAVLRVRAEDSPALPLQELRNVTSNRRHHLLVAAAISASHAYTGDQLSAVCNLPNLEVVVPSDAYEARKAAECLLLKEEGTKYLLVSEAATPVVSRADTPFRLGMANVLRLRHEAPRMVDAFEQVLAYNYENEHEDLTVAATGPMLAEAMRAAWILRREFGYETRILNLHTLRPLDGSAIERAARETGILITAEEHQTGPLAWRVSRMITENPQLYGKPVLTGAVSAKDGVFSLGSRDLMLRERETSAEFIAQKAAELVAAAKVKNTEQYQTAAY